MNKGGMSTTDFLDFCTYAGIDPMLYLEFDQQRRKQSSQEKATETPNDLFGVTTEDSEVS